MSEVSKNLAKELSQWMDSNANQLPFKDLFSSDRETRVVIPFNVDPTAEVILKKLKEAGELNLNTGTIKFRNQDIRLGKFILNKKSPFNDNEREWWNHSGNALSELKEVEAIDQYVIILSRNPIDIVRMSDHDGWSSCHGPRGSYFSCAIADAKGSGAVAYVVRKSDLEKIQDLQTSEIFSDSDRGVKGIEPLSRLRLRRFINKEDDDYDLAVPEDRTYGRRIPGFEESVRRWALKKQTGKMEEYGNKRPRLKDFQLVGGSYQDTLGSHLFNNFFDDDLDRGEAEYGGEEEGQNMADQMEQEINQLQDQYRNAFTICSFYASIEEMDAEHPYVTYGGSVHLSVPKEMLIPQKQEAENVPWRDRRSYVVKEELRRWARDNDIYADEVEVEENMVTFYLHDEDSNLDPDSFHDFLRYTLKYIEKEKDKLQIGIYRKFVELGLAKPTKVLNAQESHTFKNFEWEESDDEIELLLKKNLILEGEIVHDLKFLKERFRDALMKGIVTWADRVFEWEKRQGQLFKYEIKRPFSGEFKIIPNIWFTLNSSTNNKMVFNMKMSLIFEPLMPDDHTEDVLNLVTFLDNNYEKFIRLIYDTWNKLPKQGFNKGS